MASKTAGRSLQNIIKRSRQTCECNPKYLRPIRQFFSSASRKDTEYENDKVDRPRWSYTPEKMKAPVAWRIKDTDKKWECNSDPARLDNFYVKFLGQGGDKMLSDEVKWLAITHKSFDQGRRGFNDRLAFLGMDK
jgi:large subunit ribosomal protein L15